jgi:hypothetical protein
MKITKLLPALALTALLVPAAAGTAQAAVRTGTLTCDIGGGIGVILGSSKPVACRYTAFDGLTELYNGTVRKFGVDVGFTWSGRIVWAVFEPGREHGSLAGNYAGVSAEASVGAGVGANVLLGGGNGSVTLQPISVQGQTGLNAAAGIGTLNIEPVAAAVVVRPHRVYRHHRVHRCTCSTKHKRYHHRKTTYRKKVYHKA